MKNFNIFILFVLLISPFARIEAAVLDNGYLLVQGSSGSTSSQSPTGSVTLSGIVYPLVQGQNPSVAQIYYKSQKNGTQTVTDHPAFSPSASGEFSHTINNLDCGATYQFWLYESPDDTLIQVDTIGGSLSNAFALPINCNNGNVPTTSAQDIMAPQSAGAQVIAGVNWGNLLVTDTSLNVVNARIIPFVYGGSKTFKVEYGEGGPNQYNQPENGGTFLGFSQNITRTPPYNFSLQIGALAPDTEYYLTLWEVGPNNVETNLLTYTFVMTNSLNITGSGSQTMNYTFPNATSLNVYGHLFGANNQPLDGLPITVEVRAGNNPNSQLIDSANLTVASDIINGAGFYQNTFTGLTPDTVYFVFIRNANTQAVLYGPVEVITPSPAGSGTSTSNVPTPPTYDGLVACDGPDCDFNTLIDTINRVINFLIFYIGFPIVAIVVGWAGVKLLTSGGSEKAKTEAKKMIFKVIIGLIVALLCWAIIKLILVSLGYTSTGPLWQVFGINPSN